jgi:FAD/FMN-containing dehydrogenase
VYSVFSALCARKPHDQSATLLYARQHRVVLIPYGGGTSVSHALMVPENLKRSVVAVDMKEMNAIQWVGGASHRVCGCIASGLCVLTCLFRVLVNYNSHVPSSTDSNTTQHNTIQVNKRNMLASIQAGAVGKQLEASLKQEYGTFNTHVFGTLRSRLIIYVQSRTL